MRVYEEADYANSRLAGTIVRLKGIPILVERIVGDKAWYHKLSNTELKACKLNDLDINPVPLGYANTLFGATYVTRTPMRQDWRQGLRRQTIRTIPERIEVDFASLERTIMGVYPTLKECQKQLAADPFGVQTMAFSRSFAVDRTDQLYYKGRFNIGKVGLFGYNLADKFDWLRETVEEEMLAA